MRIMIFGKYKGMPIDMLPDSYVAYLFNNAPLNIRIRHYDLLCEIEKVSKIKWNSKKQVISNMSHVSKWKRFCEFFYLLFHKPRNW